MTSTTEAQQRVYDFIAAYITARGYSPTFREIEEAMGFKSLNAVSCHLTALERKGLVRQAKGIARGITLIQADTVPTIEREIVTAACDYVAAAAADASTAYERLSDLVNEYRQPQTVPNG